MACYLLLVLAAVEISDCLAEHLHTYKQYPHLIRWIPFIAHQASGW